MRISKKQLSPKELEEKANEYFSQYPHPDNFATLEDKQNAIKSIQLGLIPTINGLIKYLGFSNLNDYYKLSEINIYKSIINSIRTTIASYWELNLNSKFSNGASFWLKNVQGDNWQDKIEQVQTLPPVACVVYVGQNKSKSKNKTIDIQAESIPVKAIPTSKQ